MMHSLNAATLVPLLSRESGNPNAGGVLATTPRGEAATLDIWESSDTSHNFLVLGGRARHGSAVMAELAGDALSRGGSVCVLDIHGEFREISELTDTRSLKLSPHNPVSFNPFTGVDMQDAALSAYLRTSVFAGGPQSIAQSDCYSLSSGTLPLSVPTPCPFARCTND
jgi:hypothetical protein